MGIDQLRDALPRAFWVGSAEIVPDPGRRWARLEEPSFDPRRACCFAAPAPVSVLATSEPGPACVTYEPVDPHTFG